MFHLLSAISDGASPDSPWLVGGGVALIPLLAFLIWKVFRVGSNQMLLANKQAAVLVEPLERQVTQLTAEVEKCKSESFAERMWFQILTSRLEHIIRENGIPIPEGTWVRP